MRWLIAAWLLLIVVALAVVVLPTPPARAQAGDEDAYSELAGSALTISPAAFESVRRGVEQLAISGDPRAAAVIGALHDGLLYARDDRALFIQQPDGKYTDARTGAPAPDVSDDDVKPVRVNNAVRGAIDEALGVLQLFAPDAPTRLHAASAVFTSHDPAALPALDKALAKETNPEVRRRMQQAQAAALLSAPNASQSDKLAAVTTLRARGDQDARSQLAALAGQSGPVATAAAAAVISIDRILQIWSLAESVYYGISLGSVLLLAAAGLAITFGVMGVINMAHGEMVMIGAYVTFVVQQLMHAYLPSLYAFSLLIAVPMAFLVSGGIGVAVERSLIRWLYGRPLETLLATWGLSLVMQQVVRSLFGANNRQVDTPGWMSGAFQLGGLTLTYNRVYIILFAFLVIAALMAALRYTPLGLRMRAVTQNRRMAAAMGIRTPWIDALTFGLGSGVAGIAGVALSQIDNVSPNLGQGYIIDSFMVVVFGGVGNLWGTTLGALTLGIVNKFLEPIAGAVLAKIVVLVLLILFVQRNPRGMFPLKGRAVEA
ncbi:urea ABC transporter permease subunit UrtB [Rhodopila sp.]|uniref:urea ABC transporter permease subunit UrtB n=1 Tax=Rhodopila sp. TaxID=2480087 RepID=UPI003D12F4AA